MTLIYYLWVVFLLVSYVLLQLIQQVLPLLLLLLTGAYLLRKRSVFLRTLGGLFLLLFAYSYISWLSPWYVLWGTDRVQKFSLDKQQFGRNHTVMLMDTPPRLILVPYEAKDFTFEHNKSKNRRQSLVLLVDLNTRQTKWLPRDTINFSDTSTVKHLDYNDYTKDKIDSQGNLSLFYASSSKVGLRSEFSFIGFRLPKWVYSEQPLSLIGGESFTGWKLETTHFGWERLAVRESASGSTVVEMKRVFVNKRRDFLIPSTQTWLFGGKFFVFESRTKTERDIFVFKPLNTSLTTYPSDKKVEEKP